jgi:hypothetical protein
MDHPYKIGVAESNGDVTRCLGRPLAADFDYPPLTTNLKPLITSKRFELHGKYVLNTNRKPWSKFQMMTSDFMCGAP